MTPAATRPALRLIQGELEAAPAWSWFCGQCAGEPSREPTPLTRVCRACGMGLLLETRADAVPGRDDAFLIVDSRLTVQAVSRRAQRLLGVREEDAIDRPVARFLAAAGAETEGGGNLMTLLRSASTGSDELQSLFVSPPGAYGIRISARIAPCGPPRAALVVLDVGAPRHELRLV